MALRKWVRPVHRNQPEVPVFGEEAMNGDGLDAFGNEAFSALRLPNGNTIIGNGKGHSVLEVLSKCHDGSDNLLLVQIAPKTKKAVWSFDRFDLLGNSAPNSLLLIFAVESIR